MRLFLGAVSYIFPPKDFFTESPAAAARRTSATCSGLAPLLESCRQIAVKQINDYRAFPIFFPLQNSEIPTWLCTMSSLARVSGLTPEEERNRWHKTTWKNPRLFNPESMKVQYFPGIPGKRGACGHA